MIEASRAAGQTPPVAPNDADDLQLRGEAEALCVAARDRGLVGVAE